MAIPFRRTSESRSRSARFWLAALAVTVLAATAAHARGRDRVTYSSTPGTTVVRMDSTGPDNSHSHSWSYDDDAHSSGPDAWVLVREHGDWNNGSGTDDDWLAGKAAVERAGDDGLWFRMGHERYLVTDPAVLKRAAEIVAPQEELGRRQGRLGRRQGQIGRMQGELGWRQGSMARMRAELALLHASVASAGERARDQAERARIEDELRGLESEIGALQRGLGEQQRALGAEQSAMGSEQRRIGRRVNEQLLLLMRDCIDRGVAKGVER